MTDAAGDRGSLPALLPAMQGVTGGVESMPSFLQEFFPDVSEKEQMCGSMRASECRQGMQPLRCPRHQTVSNALQVYASKQAAAASPDATDPCEWQPACHRLLLLLSPCSAGLFGTASVLPMPPALCCRCHGLVLDAGNLHSVKIAPFVPAPFTLWLQYHTPTFADCVFNSETLSLYTSLYFLAGLLTAPPASSLTRKHG